MSIDIKPGLGPNGLRGMRLAGLCEESAVPDAVALTNTVKLYQQRCQVSDPPHGALEEAAAGGKGIVIDLSACTRHHYKECLSACHHHRCLISEP